MLNPDLLDLRKQLGLYKIYHHNKINVLLHSIFVPIILFTSACMLHRVPLFSKFTVTHFFSLLFAIFYITLYFPTGILASSLLLLMNITLDLAWIST